MINLINDDSISHIRKMISEGNKVDLLITDPPYKITSRGGYTSAGGMLLDNKVRNGKVFDNNNLEIEDWLPLFYNVLNDDSHCYIMTNNKNITNYLKVIDELYFNGDKKQKFHFIKNLIWLKDNKIMSQTYMSQFEYIIMLRKGKHKRINDCGTSDVLQFPNKKTKDENNKTIHNTEKPVELMEVLIKNSSNENDIVFDPFMGIGSTGIASKIQKRRFIGCEIDKRYFNIAKERIN